MSTRQDHDASAASTVPGVEDLLGDAYLVRIRWSESPIPCFRLVFLEKLAREQWADEGGWTPEQLRVKARELVARGLKVEPVDCPANVTVFYDQAAVERMFELREREEAS